MIKKEQVRQGSFPFIGHNIRLQEQKHLRDMDLAAKLQLEGIPISTSTLSKIEQGACNPSTEQLVALQGILGGDYNVFLSLLKPSLPWLSIIPDCPVTAYFFSASKKFLRVIPSLLTSPCHIPYAARRAHSPLGGISFSKNSPHITMMLFRFCLSA